ncbi:MAG TPA: IclR family transcriptional regulator C-terminal domain-containing protein [Bryobacteraceae bacterium]|nr:IclR family transcriptional regulator C-terminal domain-containing protein [Bryobacteraceae bacterium]
MPMVKSGDPDYVLSLARGLQVIEAFNDSPRGRTVSELAAATGLSRAAVRRLLITLQQLGYAEHDGTVHRLTTRILRLGFSYLSSTSLTSLAIPILEQLSARIHESCSVSVLDGDQIVYVARAASNRVMGVDLSVGSRLPAYCTSMGRVLLSAMAPADLRAFLKNASLKRITPKTLTSQSALFRAIDAAREHGYALVDEELEIGLRSIAVPVRAESGRIVAAMNTGVHAARITRGDLTGRILPELRAYAHRLGQMLP